MGIAEVRNAFAAAIGPLYSVTRAELGYDRVEGPAGGEWQVITFYGNSAEGQPFSHSTGPIDPNDDPVVQAQIAALDFLENRPNEQAPASG